jgi:hypothetical protein
MLKLQSTGHLVMGYQYRCQYAQKSPFGILQHYQYYQYSSVLVPTTALLPPYSFSPLNICLRASVHARGRGCTSEYFGPDPPRPENQIFNFFLKQSISPQPEEIEIPIFLRGNYIFFLSSNISKSKLCSVI